MFPPEVSEIQTLNNPNGKNLPFGTELAVKQETKNRFDSARFSHDFRGFEGIWIWLSIAINQHNKVLAWSDAETAIHELIQHFL